MDRLMPIFSIVIDNTVALKVHVSRDFGRCDHQISQKHLLFLGTFNFHKRVLIQGLG